MRQQILPIHNTLHRNIPVSLQTNNPCSDSYCEDFMFTSHKSLTTSFTFKKCFFNTLSDALEKEGGGASFFNNEDGKLKVEKSQFYSCEYSFHGGAIYVSSSFSRKLLSSIFCSCKAVTNGMGGAVYIHSTDDVLVQNSIFLLCESVQFGSGL